MLVLIQLMGSTGTIRIVLRQLWLQLEVIVFVFGFVKTMKTVSLYVIFSEFETIC